MPQFHETRMGVRFFEADLPRLIEQLTIISKQFTRMNDLAEKMMEAQGIELGDEEES